MRYATLPHYTAAAAAAARERIGPHLNGRAQRMQRAEPPAAKDKRAMLLCVLLQLSLMGALSELSRAEPS